MKVVTNSDNRSGERLFLVTTILLGAAAFAEVIFTPSLPHGHPAGNVGQNLAAGSFDTILMILPPIAGAGAIIAFLALSVARYRRKRREAVWLDAKLARMAAELLPVK